MTGHDRHDEERHRIAASAMSGMLGLARAMQLYQPNNAAVDRIIQRLLAEVALWKQVDTGPLELQLLSEDFFICGQLLRLDGRGYEAARELEKLLSRFELGLVRLHPDVSEDDLRSFAVELQHALRGERPLAPGRWGGIELGPLQGQSVAAFRFRPERLAVWLLASLLDLVEELEQGLQEGREVSLLPLKRLLVHVAGGIRVHGPIYQVMVAVRDHRRPMEPGRYRAAIAIEAMGFCTWLEMRRSEVLAMGLAAILSQMLLPVDPDETLRALLALEGLGVSGELVAAALHGERRARRGEQVPAPGRILALAEGWVELIGGENALPPNEALGELVSGGVTGVDPQLAWMFTAWKGPSPPGSPVRLSDGTMALVVGWSEGRGRWSRPVVAPILGGGELGGNIDLALRDDIEIVEGLDPAGIALDLTRLHRPGSDDQDPTGAPAAPRARPEPLPPEDEPTELGPAGPGAGPD